MSNYFNLELDTTPPKAVIHTLEAVTENDSISIVIDGNEIFDDFYDAYLIDSAGERHNIRLIRESNRFVGVIKYKGMSAGSAIIRVSVRDLVRNETTAFKVVRIQGAEKLTLNIKDYSLKVSTKDFKIQQEIRDVISQKVEIESHVSIVYIRESKI